MHAERTGTRMVRQDPAAEPTSAQHRNIRGAHRHARSARGMSPSNRKGQFHRWQTPTPCGMVPAAGRRVVHRAPQMAGTAHRTVGWCRRGSPDVGGKIPVEDALCGNELEKRKRASENAVAKNSDSSLKPAQASSGRRSRSNSQMLRQRECEKSFEALSKNSRRWAALFFQTPRGQVPSTTRVCTPACRRTMASASLRLLVPEREKTRMDNPGISAAPVTMALFCGCGRVWTSAALNKRKRVPRGKRQNKAVSRLQQDVEILCGS